LPSSDAMNAFTGREHHYFGCPHDPSIFMIV
jgi:hypothetical protein